MQQLCEFHASIDETEMETPFVGRRQNDPSRIRRQRGEDAHTVARQDGEMVNV